MQGSIDIILQKVVEIGAWFRLFRCQVGDDHSADSKTVDLKED